VIGKSDPRAAEYLRGFRRGIQHHVIFLGKLGEPVHAHFFPGDAHDGNSEDPYLDAYVHGYRDGCRGLIPEYIS
jgi:hypothetical protein